MGSDNMSTAWRTLLYRPKELPAGITESTCHRDHKKSWYGSSKVKVAIQEPLIPSSTSSPAQHNPPASPANTPPAIGKLESFTEITVLFVGRGQGDYRHLDHRSPYCAILLS